MTLYTIGHSNRTQEELLDLLLAHGIEVLVDVRTVPKSRAHPHFVREAMAAWLPAGGVEYRHAPPLGGLRRPRPDSTNNAWTEPGFRGFADYALTPPFAAALANLLALAGERRTTVMCAEAVWWRCHRRIITDWALAAGAEVQHILGPGEPKPGTLTPFARVEAGLVT